jgi:hypothetical protein
VKPPYGLVNKGMNFNLFYDKNAVARVVAETDDFDYGNAGRLKRFQETHPAVYHKRISAVNWIFNFDPTKGKNTLSFRQKILQKIYEWTGIRIGEYRNYKIVKR